ncbi:MAG: ABC transporter substrate-binding protein, partial [Candidatus Heimdallarchaeota archaeon]|nr:ABC transporter substrate-binding protein [Candidatus Heimdallarchaeota archaeon]
ETKEPILIGVIFPLTGDAAAYGIPLQKIANLAIEEINNAGGVNGKELKIIVAA